MHCAVNSNLLRDSTLVRRRNPGPARVALFVVPDRAGLLPWANVNAVSVDGDPPLFASATKGHARIVKLLVEAGANINLGTGLLASHEN